jgi:hypothetical protein
MAARTDAARREAQAAEANTVLHNSISNKLNDKHKELLNNK